MQALALFQNDESSACCHQITDSAKRSTPIGEVRVNVTSFQSNERLSLGVPPDFVDPIVMELMTDPVILPSGKRVDRCTCTYYVRISSDQ